MECVSPQHGHISGLGAVHSLPSRELTGLSDGPRSSAQASVGIALHSASLTQTGVSRWSTFSGLGPLTSQKKLG